MDRNYRNLGYVLLALLPIFIAGFWVPYFSEIPHFEPSITIPVHIHAALLFSFLGLLIIQPIAMRHNAVAVHRFLGRVSYVLVPLILLSAIAMLYKEYQEHLVGGANATAARNDEFLSATQLVLLTALYVLAITRIHQRDVAAHMRYMICIALVLLPAGLARTLGYWFHVRQSLSQAVCLLVIDLCLIALVWFDKRRGLTAHPYIFVLVPYLAIEASWVALGRPV